MTDEYGYTVTVAEGYDEAVVRTRLALRGEGFSILSEMHVGGLLNPDAGDERQYLFMGVWNNVLSHRRLDSELQAAVHLPCNVVVREDPSGEGALVAALDPLDTLATGDEDSRPAAEDARAALSRVLERVTGRGPGGQA